MRIRSFPPLLNRSFHFFCFTHRFHFSPSLPSFVSKSCIHKSLLFLAISDPPQLPISSQQQLPRRLSAAFALPSAALASAACVCGHPRGGRTRPPPSPAMSAARPFRRPPAASPRRHPKYRATVPIGRLVAKVQRHAA